MVARRPSLLCAALLVACSGDPAPGGRAARAPAAPVARAPGIPEQLAACAAPAPDPAALGDAARSGRYPELEGTLDVLLQAYADDPGCEEHLWTAFGALARVPLESLDRWAAERSDSWAAFTARGGHYLDSGYASRGEKLARDVTDEQWDGMRKAFARAGADLQRAVELRPDGFVAYGYAIGVFRASGGGEPIAEWLGALLTRDPLNRGVRERAMQALTPNWGGSLEEMEEVAEQAQPFAERNPRLRILAGYPIVAEANLAWRDGDLARAAAGYRRGLAYGDLWLWHNGLAKLLDKQREWRALKAHADAWLALGNADPAPWMWRSRALLALGNPGGALEDADHALTLTPQDPYLLRLRGDALGRLGRLADSLAAFEAALALAPDDAWTISQVEKARERVHAHSQQGGTLPALSQLGLSGASSKGEVR
jgi:tetratricopeptide (TPR) repeat protein